MTGVEELRALLARVQQATGPERGIDFYVHTYFGGEGTIARCPKYSASIDAALALVERVLPGSHWGRDAHEGEINLWLPAREGMWSVEHAKAATPPLAILSALLRAKIAEAESLPGGRE